jgi:hypothetical protein
MDLLLLRVWLNFCLCPAVRVLVAWFCGALIDVGLGESRSGPALVHRPVRCIWPAGREGSKPDRPAHAVTALNIANAGNRMKFRLLAV